MHDTCEGCFNHMGGGCCRINLENECAKGERQMYKPAKESGPFESVMLAWLWACDKDLEQNCLIVRRDSGHVVVWEDEP